PCRVVEEGVVPIPQDAVLLPPETFEADEKGADTQRQGGRTEPASPSGEVFVVRDEIRRPGAGGSNGILGHPNRPGCGNWLHEAVLSSGNCSRNIPRRPLPTKGI